jgi:Xaa-Pro aminopeptidase
MPKGRWILSLELVIIVVVISGIGVWLSRIHTDTRLVETQAALQQAQKARDSLAQVVRLQMAKTDSVIAAGRQTERRLRSTIAQAAETLADSNASRYELQAALRQTLADASALAVAFDSMVSVVADERQAVQAERDAWIAERTEVSAVIQAQAQAVRYYQLRDQRRPQRVTSYLLGVGSALLLVLIL